MSKEDRRRPAEGGREGEPKRPKIEGEERLMGLIAKVGDRQDQVLNHLMGLTEALLKDLPVHYFHIMNQIMKSVFTLHHKLPVYSSLTSLLAKRCAEHFTPDSSFPRGADFGARVVRLTVEMLDRNLVDSVWWKTLLLIQFASELVLVRVLHPATMWGLLREITDEVLSMNNSNNRRDAYCYMVLSALLITGHALHRWASAYGRTAEAADGAFIEVEVPDFQGMLDDISYFMRNRPNKDAEDSTLGTTWKKIQEWHKEDWQACQATLEGKPYMSTELQERFGTAQPNPSLSLKRMRARGTGLDKRATPATGGAPDAAAGGNEDALNAYIARIAECRKRGDLDDAYRMWTEMQKKGIKPTAAAYLAIFSVCAIKGDTKKAQEFWDQMLAEGLPITVKAYNALLNVYARAGDSQMFEKFAELQRSETLKPDITTFNILAAGCEQLENPEKAASLLAVMRECKVEPDTQFFAVLLRACRVGGNVALCTSLWTELTRTYGVEPDKNVFRALELVFQAAAQINLNHFRLRPLRGLCDPAVETLSFRVPSQEDSNTPPKSEEADAKKPPQTADCQANQDLPPELSKAAEAQHS
eukprot:EG_transcript_7013